MSSINSVTSYLPSITSSKATQSSYDANAQAYGPVVASIAGAADAVGDSVSAICSFSAESLGKLGDAVESEYDALGKVVESAWQSVEDEAATVATTVSDAGKAVSDAVGGAVHDLEAEVSSAALAVGGVLSSIGDGISSAASKAANYASLGVSAAAQAINAIV